MGDLPRFDKHGLELVQVVAHVVITEVGSIDPVSIRLPIKVSGKCNESVCRLRQPP
jgi:hypothetical protein